MKLVGVISTAVLSLTFGAAAPVYAQQDQHDQQEEQKVRPSQDEKKAQPAKQGEKSAQQDKNTNQEEKNAQQQEHCMIADLFGKGKHVRTVPVPLCAKRSVDEWIAAAAITDGEMFRRISHIL